MAVYEVRRDPVSKKTTSVFRTADAKDIPIAPGNMDYDEFLIWNAQQIPPLDVSDGIPTLNELKLQRALGLSADTRTYVELHYVQYRQQTFTYLHTSGGANRRAQIQQIWDWINSVFDYYYTKEDEITAAANEAALAAITWSFSQFDVTDPVKTIRVVRAIPD